jgi:hypothetical protein
MSVNRQQDPRSKRQEEFDYQVHLARRSDEAMNSATPEVQEAARNQAAFSERRKKYLGGK